MHDTQNKFSGRTIGLHWIIAVGMITMLIIGLIMHNMADTTSLKWDLYHIHKSLGVVIFPFAVYRIFWRIRNGFPQSVGNYTAWKHILAKVIHYILIIGTVLMPISGMMMSGAGGFGIPLFFFEIVPSNFVDNKAIAYNATLVESGYFIHEIGSKLIITGVLLHIAGAVKHHVIDKDGTIWRMLGRSLDDT